VCKATTLDRRQQVFVPADEHGRRQWWPLALEEMRQVITAHPGQLHVQHEAARRGRRQVIEIRLG
jgi:hypothetical protein